jgi:hypothetical protein
MKCQVRVSERVWADLSTLIFRRYPRKEWGTFLDCGWVEAGGELILTIQGFKQPVPGELDEEIPIFGVNDCFTERVALAAENSKLAVGVVHSHPEDCACFPSELDDDMDGYFSKYFSSFAPGRPYLSVIFSVDEFGALHFSGRCWWKGEWLKAEKVSITGKRLLRVWGDNVERKSVPDLVRKRLGRLVDGLGVEAADLLWNSFVVVIGAGGTGSPAIHSLVRAGVGKIAFIDPQLLDYTNAERIHGVLEADLLEEPKPAKVEIARRLVKGISSDVEVIALKGNALDPEALKLLAAADVILGCTDSEHGRALVSDIATRLLIPALHVNVGMEGEDEVTGEIVHFTQYAPGLPCAYCRGQVDGQLLAQELMSESEREARMEMAQRIEEGAAYWRNEPIIPTIGALTTIAGEHSANYAVGLLTGRYASPATFFEINLVAPGFGMAEAEFGPLKSCLCQKREGLAGQIEPLVSRS